MDIGVLCQLLAEKINPKKFQFWGSDIKWLIEPTKEELAIMDDVIKNYYALEAEYLVKQKEEEEIQDEIVKLKTEDELVYRTRAIENIERRNKSAIIR